jgi:hypothetical protein
MPLVHGVELFGQSQNMIGDLVDLHTHSFHYVEPGMCDQPVYHQRDHDEVRKVCYAEFHVMTPHSVLITFVVPVRALKERRFVSMVGCCLMH